MSARAATLRRGRTAERSEHLSVVDRRSRAQGKPRSRRSHRKGFAIAVSAGLAGAIVVGVLLEQVVLAQSAFELAQLRKDVATAEARHEELLLEAASLDSATRIERYARSSLGMVDPAPGTVEYIVADVRTGATLQEATVDEGEGGRAAVTGMRAAASYGESP